MLQNHPIGNKLAENVCPKCGNYTQKIGDYCNNCPSCNFHYTYEVYNDEEIVRIPQKECSYCTWSSSK